MPDSPRVVRVTVSLPEDLYQKVRGRTDNFSAFVAECLARRLRGEDLAKALADTSGLMVDAFAELKTPEAVVAYLHHERAAWNRNGR